MVAEVELLGKSELLDEQLGLPSMKAIVGIKSLIDQIIV